jgi:hypothetical protein
MIFVVTPEQSIQRFFRWIDSLNLYSIYGKNGTDPHQSGKNIYSLRRHEAAMYQVIISEKQNGIPGMVSHKELIENMNI